MLVVNPVGKIVLANAQVEKLFGYRREELLGQEIETQLERFFTAKIARIEPPASEGAGKPMAGKVPPFQPVE
jgi:PAS domain S-box-containing protein